MFAGGRIGLYALVGVSAFMSLMFPTIYGLALDKVGEDAELGSAGLIMAIVGGALLTPWMAAIIGDASSVWTHLVPMFASEWDTNLKLSQMSLRASFIVPAKATVCQSFAFPSNRISGVAISHIPLLEVDTSEMNILGYSSQARRKSSMGSIASSDASSAQRARTILRKIPVSSWA
jgi:hypothetical protein